MPSAFFTGLAGLRAHARAVEVIANNLANLNTISFKGSRSDFRDLFYQKIGQSRSGVSSQVGIGVSPITVSRRFDQGTVQNTGGLLDAAIQGEGYFIVEDGNLRLYTRAGNFQLNTNQELVAINGEIVKGWIRDPLTGVVNTNLPLVDITLQGNDRIDPKETANITVSGNLSSSAVSPFKRPIQVFDSLGSPHILTMVFTPATPNPGAARTFDVTVTIEAGEVIDDVTSLPPLVAPNLVASVPFQIDFDTGGNMILPVGSPPYQITLDMGAVVPNSISYANQAADLLISWDLLDQFNLGRLTSVDGASAITSISQDGSPSAELTSISIADGGTINGLFSDGRTLVLAQLALARFPNAQGLSAVGNNNFVPTAGAGLPIDGPANTAGLGSIVGLSLEFSNVDIAQEFTNLLTYQRGFQANSRVITTADELNQEALALKR